MSCLERYRVLFPHEFYEDALAQLVATGAIRFRRLELTGDRWFEVDDLRDLAQSPKMYMTPIPMRHRSS